MQLGERIRIVRKARGKTLREVWEETNISVSFLSSVENGRHCPSLNNLALLAGCFGMSLSSLLEDVEFPGVEHTLRVEHPPELAAFLQEMEEGGQQVSSDVVEILRMIRGLDTTRKPWANEEWKTAFYTIRGLIR